MAPLLMLPHPEEKTEQVHSISLLSLQQQHPSIVHSLVLHSTQNLQDCIGSSQGCLAFLDPINSDPFLLNPISQTLHHLPKTQTLPKTHHPHQLRHPKIEKLVLCGKTAVIMYVSAWDRTSVAFSTHNDPVWTLLPTRIETCHDVVCHDATNTAFVLGPGPTVEAWDMSGRAPCLRTIIGGLGVSCQGKLARAVDTLPPGLFSTRRYVAVSESGQVFVAVRYIDEGNESGPSVYPYKTIGFDVFEHVGEEWVEVESLGDWAMFLGGNESMMVWASDEVKGNAIYFTDDYWERVDEDCCYGGHDMGVFNLEDGRVEPVLGCDQESRIVPPPFWISV